MLGWEARVSEREQNGRAYFRVRVGPFAKRDDAEQLKDKLKGAGVESTLVRVQRDARPGARHPRVNFSRGHRSHRYSDQGD